MPPTARLWESLRTSYWFVPSVLGAAALCAAFGFLQLDARVGERLPLDAWWLYGGSASGARGVLAAIVGSMISVTSVVFSITIVVLSLASGQFGPRLVRSFMRDRATQFVMGVFIATFAYALIILGAVEGVDDRGFVPRLSVMFGVLLVVASAGFLIFFIHHIALSIQADYVVASLSTEVRETLDRLYPDGVGRSSSRVERREEEPGGEWDGSSPHAREVPADGDGYIQVMRAERLMEIAQRRDLVIRLAHLPGEWVVRGQSLAWLGSAAPRDPQVGEEIVEHEIVEEVRSAIVLGRHRSLAQDAEFGFLQIVEVAVRALSPGINDPFTAMTCIDWLSALLCDLARRDLPDRYRYDGDGRLRLVVPVTSFTDFVESSFRRIRQYAGGSAVVLGRLLEAIDTVLRSTVRQEQRDALILEARLVMRAAEGADLTPSDLSGLVARRAAVAATAAKVAAAP